MEGIGNSKNPHPVQERIAKWHGSQCGFCTPGIVMVGSLSAAMFQDVSDYREEPVANVGYFLIDKRVYMRC